MFLENDQGRQGRVHLDASIQKISFVHMVLMSIFSTTHASFQLSMHASIHVFIHPSIHPPPHPSNHPSIHQPSHPSIHLIYSSIHSSILLSIHLSIHLFSIDCTLPMRWTLPKASVLQCKTKTTQGLPSWILKFTGGYREINRQV